MNPDWRNPIIRPVGRAVLYLAYNGVTPVELLKRKTGIRDGTVKELLAKGLATEEGGLIGLTAEGKRYAVEMAIGLVELGTAVLDRGVRTPAEKRLVDSLYLATKFLARMYREGR